MLKKIFDNLNNLNIEEAFNLIIANENRLAYNSSYWALRAKLCDIIGEIDSAFRYYEKSISIDIHNIFSINQIINLVEKNNLNYDIELYKKLDSTLISSPLNIALNLLTKDLKLENSDNNKAILKDRIFDKFKEILYLKGTTLIGKNEVFSLLDLDRINLNKYKIIVPLSPNYIEEIKQLSQFGANSCSVVILEKNDVHIIDVNKNIMDNLRLGLRDKTIAMHYLNRGDSNVYALHKLMPAELKKKYNVLLFKGYEPYYLENKVLIPLIAKISIAGHSTFLSYPIPELMINIEVGHGTMPIKACGALDKMPGFAFTPWQYKNVDKLCVTSHMDMLLWISFTGIHKDNVLISGTPRTDLLINSNGKSNLEKLLNTKLTNKKVIFNMPTFHKHENSGRVNGNEELDSFIKIPNFDYKAFDDFLGKNNYICVLKVHHAEESIISQKKTLKDFKNIYAISNKDLEDKNLDLYEIVNAGDLLITDYSTIYTDFLFMNKPIVFTNYDLDEYRENRGIALEPYDFWTAGPKVQKQEDLEFEIKESLSNKDYYIKEREYLRPVFFKTIDNKSSHRIWDYIDSKLNI